MEKQVKWRDLLQVWKIFNFYLKPTSACHLKGWNIKSEAKIYCLLLLLVLFCVIWTFCILAVWYSFHKHRFLHHAALTPHVKHLLLFLPFKHRCQFCEHVAASLQFFLRKCKCVSSLIIHVSEPHTERQIYIISHIKFWEF